MSMEMEVTIIISHWTHRRDGNLMIPIRIHQLTLPESLFYASKLIPTSQDQNERDDEGYPLSPLGVGEPSRRRQSSSSTTNSYPFPRKSLDLEKRERSSSTSTARPLDPPSPTVSLHHTLPRTRVTRPRAPTLAGEAIEHSHHPHPVESPSLDRIESRSESQVPTQREPLRCFVALKLPPTNKKADGKAVVEEDVRRRTKSDERDLRSPNGIGIRKVSRTNSSTSVPTTPTKPTLRHHISSSSTSSSSTELPRQRTVSLTSPSRAISNGLVDNGDGRPTSSLGHSLGRTSSRLSDTSSIHSILRSPPGILRGSKSKASLGISHQFAHSQNQLDYSPTKTDFEKSEMDNNGLSPVKLKNIDGKEKLAKKKKEQKVEVEVPFYISPIHPPSTNPRFLGLDYQNDFGGWMTPLECSGERIVLELWVEIPEEKKWKRLDLGVVDLRKLRKGRTKQGINGIEITLSTDPKEVYHLPTPDELEEEGSGVRRKGMGVIERSLRETRMKKGIGVGGLHQLVNLQAVIADTERSIEEVRRKVDRLLLKDTDGRCLRREISERQSRIEWFESKIAEVEKLKRETQARTTLKQQDIDVRRDNLEGAGEADELLRGRGRDLEDDIGKIDSERLSLLPQIHSLRAHHIQTLDLLFPIQPLDPSQLLYTILNVPLPIPIGPKDPAPPLTMTQHKVDEKTTAAALGYVALIVQILGNLGGATGGLPYAVTCAGSRSSVRDGTGVMQGPRSFPLYAKGVERFRFEYAVFLLNMNIQMLMQESSIRSLDLRHTLPNLKNLLLTLSSPNLPQQNSMSRAVSYRSTTPTMWSRTSSAAWGKQSSLSPGSVHSNSNSSPFKKDLLSPSPLRTIRKGKYGDIGRGIDLEGEDGSGDEGMDGESLTTDSLAA
uniref:Uncharacterized protein n=1 Tax=Kwoniella bestiolae CBS 10118 TaxID=1296100 RepID=A0A1B9FSY4_9TREE|nr:hypothetical protein I302_08666 [Kwoniella bestiolae CBS 10118]OCF21887.1 hypothetical protein I302_08666 [Kwoniella bestiolae CBS 10118]